MAKMKEVSNFLDDLRRSGVTNMFGAGPYIQAAFGVDKKTAQALLIQWMQAHNETED
jgi:hypothetical protein